MFSPGVNDGAPFPRDQHPCTSGAQLSSASCLMLDSSLSKGGFIQSIMSF